MPLNAFVYEITKRRSRKGRGEVNKSRNEKRGSG